MTAPPLSSPTAAPRRPLLPTPVALLWFAAALVWATGRLAGRFIPFGVDSPADPRLPLLALLWSLPTTIAVVLAAVGLAVLWMRREPDPLSRVGALSASIMAVAGAISAVALLALVAAGPDRPIGLIDLPVGTGAALATAAAGASTAVLIRPYVDVMAAHIWAGIGGAGIALPFMVAGVSPMFIMAGAMLLATLDRVHGLRVEADLAFRHALEAERIAQEGDAGRGIGVSGLPGRPPTPRAPRPTLPWSARERSLTIWLGVAAIVIVALAWAVGATLGELGFVDVVGLIGPGYAVVAFGLVPLIWQSAMLLRVVPLARYGLTVASGILIAASLAVLTAPIPAVYLGAVLVQSLTIGFTAALLIQRGTTLGRLMLGTTAALAWLLVLVPTGALPLAFIGVITTLIALRRKVRA